MFKTKLTFIMLQITIMITSSASYKVSKCLMCPEDTEYYCASCLFNLCPKCKENHEHDYSTLDHPSVKYHDKFSYILQREISLMHLPTANEMHPEPCGVYDCYYCKTQKQHKDSKEKYEKNRKLIQNIKSEALFQRQFILTGIKADFKTCQTNLYVYQSEMLTKAQRLKNRLDKGVRDVYFKHTCSKQKMSMNEQLTNLQRIEHMYEQSTSSPLQFLLSIKTTLPQIHLKLHTGKLSITLSLNKKDVMESLSTIQIKERGKRRVGKECLLKLMPDAEFHQTLTVNNVQCCAQISFASSDRIWASNNNELILTDTTGNLLHLLEDSYSSCNGGSHTVNSEGDLIYKDQYCDIKKLSNDMKTVTTFIETSKMYCLGPPLCLCWAPSRGDLLVGWRDFFSRHNKNGQLTKMIKPIYEEGQNLFMKINYVIENNNGDIVISECFLNGPGSVIVTDCEGQHRFSYKGRSPNSDLEPQGICVDAMSHILVCDFKTQTVQILDKDGHFVSYLLTRPSGLFTPYSLCYDFITHRLWVGSRFNNKVCVYRYLTQHDNRISKFVYLYIKHPL